MEIREAAETDLPAIVKLLRASLGEGLMPKSEAYWKWKHQFNPFGESPVLLAVHNGEIIGVRAFMRWEWHAEGKLIRAFRAVDTATHPDHQGKGIFSKLTKALLANGERDKIDIVFNTPNRKSKPGYLKMGWQEAGRLPISMSLKRPIRMGLNFFVRKPAAIKNDSEGARQAHIIEHPEMEDLLVAHRQLFPHILATPPSIAYLKWRYVDVPVADYYFDAVGDEGSLSVLLIFRLKTSRLGTEMRITDVFLRSMKLGKAALQLISRNAERYGADYITTSALSVLPKAGAFSLPVPGGPIVTVRKVAGTEIEDFLSYKSWRPSLGDLELF